MTSQLYQAARPHLGQRQIGFDYIFDYLKDIKDPTIIETGCARTEGNWDGDGQSSLLFDAYIKEFGGQFMTVDISPESTKYCLSKMQCERSAVCEGDSIKFLYGLGKNMQKNSSQINLLYLDSFDAPRDDLAITNKSALHHLYELTSIMPSLAPGCLIGVDDNWVVNGQLEGKGKYVYDYFKSLGIEPCLAAYQFFWKLPA
jgi:hypothetical protein